MSIDTTGSAGASSQDAVELLRVDHLRIARLLADCERLAATDADGGGSDADRAALVARLAATLTTHARIEEELFYPALASQAGVHDDRKHAEHPEILARLQELVDAQYDRAAYARHCESLAVAVRDHVAHEEATLFPAAVAALDLPALGARMAVRRAELMGDQGAD